MGQNVFYTPTAALANIKTLQTKRRATNCFFNLSNFSFNEEHIDEELLKNKLNDIENLELFK